MKNEKDLSKYLLASDIDGTIINKRFKVPRRNLKKIEDFKKQGGKFTLATGRSVESARHFAKMINLDTPAIVLNGAAIYDYNQDEILYSNPLNKAEAIRFIKEAYNNFPKIGIEIHIGTRLHVIRENIKVYEHIKNESQPAVYARIEDLSDKDWHKILFTADPDDLLLFERWVAKHPPRDSYFVKTAVMYFELLNKTANKGVALKKLGQMFDIEEKNLCAIGDYYNDIELIDGAGIGCYTETAPIELQKTADFISCNCEKGAVADFIEYIEKLK